ncbi:MAG: hypothetical protein ABJD07_15960 [Gemmatimonadaceae bacterium]
MLVKDNEHIRSDPRAFMAAFDRARATFERIDGVLGVGFGHKQKGGAFTNDCVITAFVREKKSAEALPSSERIPPLFDGYRTDVRRVLNGVPCVCENQGGYDTIQGGIQIQSLGSHPPPGIKGLGTLGCIVRKRGDTGRENVYLLSCKHVLYGNGAGKGDYVSHPYATGGAGEPIGDIDGNPWSDNVTSSVPDPSTHTMVSDVFYIDCAIARINIDCKCWPFNSTCTKDHIHYAPNVVDLQLHGVNTLKDVRSVARDPTIVLPRDKSVTSTTPRVYKVGRTTGRTAGIVRSIFGGHMAKRDLTVPGSPKIYLRNMIEIEFDVDSEPTGLNCKGRPLFAQTGDSGSVLVDEDNQVIGLVQSMLDPDAPDSPPNAPVYACHILPVLDHLHVCIPTSGGASHGSCAATDGSGIARAAPGTGDARTAGGGFTFVSREATATPGRPLGFPDPAPITDAQREQLVAIRDALRETREGRALHDTFATVRREIGYLVRNSRPVKVAWHRTQGPAFLAHALNHLRGDSDVVPLEIAGVARIAMLTRMAEVLVAHGSNPMRAAIDRYRDELLPLLSSAERIDDCLAYFAARDHVTGGAP